MIKNLTIISLISFHLAWKSVSGQPIIDNYTERNNCNDTLDAEFGGVIVMRLPENEKMRFKYFTDFNLYCDGYIVKSTGGGGMSPEVNMDWDFINENNDTMTISFEFVLGLFHFYDIPKFQEGKFEATCVGRKGRVQLDSILPADSRFRHMVIRKMVWNPELPAGVRHELRYMMLKDQLFHTYWWSECLRKISD